MKDNRGFSLIEVLIVMAILGVLAGIGVRQIDVIYGYSAREARSKIESSINSLKVSSLSKSTGKAKSVYDAGGVLSADLDIYLKIYKKDNGLYYAYLYERTVKNGVERVNTTEKKLGPRRFDITYSYVDNPTVMHTVGDESDPLIIAYNRATGGFLQQDSAEKQIQYIYCTTSNREYSLKLMPTTGKVVLD